MLAMDVWCFSKSTARIDLEKHQTRLHYWGISLCNFGESPLQFWVFLLYTKHPAAALLGELSGVARFFLVTGYTDMRKSIDGLMAIVRDTYELDPYSNSLFLFCGRRCDKDGFCLYYKRLDDGRFQWPRDSSEVRNLSRQEYRWLLEGLSIDQPKAIRPARKKDF